MRFPKQLLWILCLLLISASVFAQSKNINGKVTDAATGSPLAGVTVTLENSTQRTITNSDGNFFLEANQSGKTVLKFNYVGFGTKEVTVSGNKTVSISLQQFAKGLNEVVVVGYGTQKRVDVTGSVATVNADAFKDRPITDATQALEGIAPGVWVNQSSAQPGSDAASVQVRGYATLGDNTPLVVVDGLISSMSSVNPNDIESISVLKDASSAAIYGSRAANGVIIITTKKGKAGKPQISLNTSFGSQQATKLPKLVTNSILFMNTYNQALANQGQPAFFSQATIDQYKAGETHDSALVYPNNDWYSHMFRPALFNKNNLQISGGNEATQYLVSLGYLDQDGILIKDNSKQYTLLLNLTSRITKAIDIGMNINLMHQTQNQAWYAGGSSSMLTEVMRALPMYGTYTPTGQYAGTWVNVINAQINNPYSMVNDGINYNAWNNSQGKVYLNAEIIKGLKWNITYGGTYGDVQSNYFTPLTYVYNPLTEAQENQVGNVPLTRSLTDGYSNSSDIQFYSTLTYTKTIGKWNDVTAMLGYNQEQTNSRNFSAGEQGFSTNTLYELNAGSTIPAVSGTSSATAMRSYFGRVEYIYKDKYIFDANGRFDGSSIFGPGHRWGFFPALSAAWRVSQEDFMKNQNVFSNLKLKASWGKTGNNRIGLYQYIPTLGLQSYYDFNSTIVGGVSLNNIPNPLISWESSTKRNFGAEMGFLKNSLNIEFDYFNEKRSNILQQLQIPQTVGALPGPEVNLASVFAKGWEANANYTKTFGKVTLGGAFNVMYTHNKVTYVTTPQIGNNVIEKGQSIDAWYLIKATGIYQNQAEINNSVLLPNQQSLPTQPGDIRYQAINKDSVIGPNDRQIEGNPYPSWTYGASFNASYCGFDVSVLLQGVGAVWTYANSQITYPFLNGGEIPAYWLKDAWTPTNTNASLPRLLQYSASTSNNYMASTFWLENSAYMRVKNIQLGYTLSQNLISKIGLTYLRFYIDVQNPFTFNSSKFLGLDPESAVGGSQYPNMKIYTLGATVRF